MQLEESPINTPPLVTCRSCGAEVLGSFCSHCGEKRLTAQDHSLWTYLTEVLGLVTRLDSRLLRSIGLLVSRPGMLSVEYLEGRRVRYMTPLRLFVFVSVVYYVALTYLNSAVLPTPSTLQFNTFTTPLAVQLRGNDFYGSYAAARLERALRGSGLDYATFERRYDDRTVVFSKTLLFAVIPVIALLFAVFFARKQRRISAHLTIATHFWSFALLSIGLLLPMVLVPAVKVSAALGIPSDALVSDAVLTYALQAVFAVYLMFMLRRVYSASIWYCAAVAAVMAWSFFFIVWLYRFLLFTVTLSAI